MDEDASAAALVDGGPPALVTEEERREQPQPQHADVGGVVVVDTPPPPPPTTTTCVENNDKDDAENLSSSSSSSPAPTKEGDHDLDEKKQTESPEDNNRNDGSGNGGVADLDPSETTSAAVEGGKGYPLNSPTGKPTIVATEEDDDDDNVAASITTATPHTPPPPPPPSQQHHHRSEYASNNNNNEDDDDDVASKAAVTLAAVAAAASSKHKSPAEAAREARLVAQSFLKAATSSDDDRRDDGGGGESGGRRGASSTPHRSGGGGGAASSKNQSTLHVTWSLVQTLLERHQENSSPNLARLVSGQNAAFLQYLVLLENIECEPEDDEDTATGSEHRNPHQKSLLDDKDEDGDEDEDEASSPALGSKSSLKEEQLVLAKQACDRILAMLKNMESAYDTLLDLLPTKHAPTVVDSDDYETPVVVPDLLPPCTSAAGDATLAFFRACVGHEPSSSDAAGTPSVSNTADTASVDSLEHQAHEEAPPSPTRHGSFLGGMFKRTTAAATPMKQGPAASLSNVFRKKSFRNTNSMDDSAVGSSNRASDDDQALPSGEYPVKIEREMLGLTVENVLERTVVRTVLPGGPAKKAGAKVGSLICKVANVETKTLTHFETIDELRQSQRPLVLVMKQVSDEALRSAREEMGRLIRGSGFGNIIDGQILNPIIRSEAAGGGEGHGDDDGRPIIGADLRIDAFTTLLRRRLAEVTIPSHNNKTNKKDEGVARIGDKLIWILTLFCVGLEREAARLYALADVSGSSGAASPRRQRHSLYSHTAQDYDDAAKSVSKVLLDYTRKKVDPHQIRSLRRGSGTAGISQHTVDATGVGLHRRGAAGPPMVAKEDTSTPHEKPLLQIGDVLQRTRTFLADTTSPPAALLRGELIAFLCDVLDIDAEMELAEEESASAVAGGGGGAKAGMINDLGSAGSLLKIIVLNCPIMRSPGCESASAQQESLDPEIEEELRKRFGPREKFSTADVHRLHAGNRFLSVVHRLAASRSTSARITACSLGPVLWGHLDFPHQLQLRGVITRALHDVEVIVRKSTATVLHEIAELVFDRRAVPWLVLMCERAMTDPEPQLRSAAMTLTWHLAEHLPNAFLGNASQGSRYLRRLPNRDDPIFADVYLLQCKLLPVATRLAEDRSPSVRLAVAAQCDRLCDALGDHWSSVIIDVLLALLSDQDDRVRCEAVSCVPRLAEIVLLSVSPGEVAVSEVSILEALVPASIKLQKDPSSSVRIALATAAGDLLSLLVALQSRADEAVPIGDPTSPERSESDGTKKYKKQVDDRLIPLVQSLLNDKDPEVTSAALRAVTNATRSSVQHSRQRHMSVASAGEDDSVSLSSYHSYASDKKAPVLTPVLSEKQVLRLLPTLTELAGSRQWRVRQSAVEIVPALLGCTQKLETRSEISKLCVSLMGDKVDAVRKTAAECLCMGGSNLGSHGEDASSDWITSIVIPTIRRCAIHHDSKQRMLSLKMVEVMLLNGACPSKWKPDSVDADRIADTPIRELALIALSLTADRIANVRLNIGRTLENVLHVFDEDDLSFIKEVLMQQIQSERERDGGGDQDVLFFADRCVSRAASILDERLLVTDESSNATDEASLKG